MTEKNGKSKGIGFVSFEDPSSALDAIEEMNGFEVRGKRLKVELNKKDEQAKSNNISSLSQAKFDIYWGIYLKCMIWNLNLLKQHDMLFIFNIF